jgi:hypothetical protein
MFTYPDVKGFSKNLWVSFNFCFQIPGEVSGRHWTALHHDAPIWCKSAKLFSGRIQASPPKTYLLWQAADPPQPVHYVSASSKGTRAGRWTLVKQTDPSGNGCRIGWSRRDFLRMGSTGGQRGTPPTSEKAKGAPRSSKSVVERALPQQGPIVYYTYKIQSLNHPDKSYIGWTQDLKARLSAHNNG